MSSEVVTPDPDRTETAFAAGVISNILSFTSFSVVSQMIHDAALRNVVAAYQHRFDAGDPFPANLPGTRFEDVAAFFDKAAPVHELPALALQVRDRWQRRELRSVIDMLLNGLVEAQQDATGMTSRAPAEIGVCNLTKRLLDGLASLRRIMDPLPLFLTKPPHEASILIYLAADEIRTLAQAYDMIGTSLGQSLVNALLYQERAEQLREMAAAVPTSPKPEPVQ